MDTPTSNPANASILNDHPEFTRIQCATKAAITTSQRSNTLKQENFTLGGFNYWTDEQGNCFKRSTETIFDMPANNPQAITLKEYQADKEQYYAQIRQAGSHSYC